MSKILSGQDYLALPSTPSTWLIEPLLPSAGAMLLYGDPKVGKSYAALQLADAVMNGDNWLGFKTNKGKVVYLQFDTPRNVWQDRCRTLILKGAMTDCPFTGDRESLNAWPFDILNPDHLITLRDELQALKPDLVIVDTLREAHSADENDSTDMQHAVSALVAATQPAALCLISHARKPSQDADFSLMNDNRGSSYVVGRMDAIVRFTPKTARVSGRSLEEHTLDLEREDSGFWMYANAEQDVHVVSVLIDPSFKSVREASKELARRLGKTGKSAPEQCRGIIRRYLASHPDVKTHLRG
jgi:RecA-family ATPase